MPNLYTVTFGSQPTILSMAYTRHTQPFTLEEAIHFDVSVITEGSSAGFPMNQNSVTNVIEITRLENSLKKLRETQEFVTSYLDATPDAEIAGVLEENNVVM